MHTVSTAVTTAILLPCAGALAQSTVLNVPSVYPTIQSAIDVASNGDTVLVAAGTYNEAIDFLGKEIVVESSSGSANTTIDGQGISTALVTCINGETANSVLRGFELLNGQSGREVEGPPAAFAGGGMYINSASPTIEDVVFQNCVSGYGGGLYAIWSDSVVSNCAFNRCIAASSSGAAQVFFNNADSGNGVTFQNCSFIENYSISYGGAVHAIQGNHSFVNCDFARNGGPWNNPIRRTDYGAAISWWAGAGATLTISGCSIEDNRAKIEGGGLWVRPGYDTVEISNSTICSNSDHNVSGRYIDLGGNSICDCEGDLNNNGSVDGGDLSILLGFWGQCLEVDCAADLNNDGWINGADLSILLGKWGPCTF